MAVEKGYIEEFKVSTGGVGNPLDTTWSLRVGSFQVFTTRNEGIAEAARLAIETASVVEVEHHFSGEIDSLRMSFEYVCTAEPIQRCHPLPPSPGPGVDFRCTTKRISDCDQGLLG
jgi:hypothetical protein